LAAKLFRIFPKKNPAEAGLSKFTLLEVPLN
jgi:hypothetical protein